MKKIHKTMGSQLPELFFDFADQEKRVGVLLDNFL